MCAGSRGSLGTRRNSEAGRAFLAQGESHEKSNAFYDAAAVMLSIHAARAQGVKSEAVE